MVLTASHHPSLLPATLKRAALYCRVSTDKQEEKGTSLESQEEGCILHCQKKGYAIVSQHVYKETFTGTVYRERPLLTTLRDGARNHEFDVVVVYAFDRLARKQVHQAVIIDDLEHNGISIESVTENFDESSLGQFLRSTAAFVAEKEREKIIERTTRGRRDRALKKKQMLGQGPAKYGFAWNEDRTGWIINPVTIEVVKHIALLYYNGYTLRKIATHLTEQGIPPPLGGIRWYPSSVREILASPEYAGKAVQYKRQSLYKSGEHNKRYSVVRPAEEQIELPEGTIPRVIDEDMHEAILERLKRNKQEAARNNKSPNEALLRSGYAICGYCKGRMHTSRWRTQQWGDIVKYRCDRGNRGHGCPGGYVTIPARTLDEAAWEHAVEIIKDPSLVQQKLEQKKVKNPAEIELEAINRRDKRLKEIEGEVENLVKLAKDAPYESVLKTTAGLLHELEQEKKALLVEKKLVINLDVEYKKMEEARAVFEKRCATMREQLDDETFEPSYEFKRDAIVYFGIRAVVWRFDDHPRFIFEGDPPSIVSKAS